jgi:hypothetical protein
MISGARPTLAGLVPAGHKVVLLDENVEPIDFDALHRFDVRAYCERHGLPYHETTWGRALLDTRVEVRRGWRVEEVFVGAPAA